ncbi:MAG: hypothetical protein JST64_08300, partial [Actinobacteria bacterium]|nr:hypothetical protein [Actinomycetota bacterium]
MTASTAETTPVDEAALHVLIAAELGLLSVGVATALSFSRLFVAGTYLVPLVGAVAASWTIAVLTRRLHLGVWTSALISAMCAVLVLGWRFAPHTTVFGLPTPDTASTLLDAVRSSFAGFSTMVAPVRASDGFLVVLAPVMWTFTFFADAAALRYRGPVQAVIPDVSAFVAGGVLARETARSGTAVVFVAGLSVYALTQRLLHSTERRWASGDERRGVRSIAASGFVVVGVAVVAGALIGPHLPGDSAAVLDLRAVGRASSPRTVTSPFVGVRNLLGPQSDEILFTAQASVPAYWRLTSLDRYDATRDIWVSSTSYRDVDGADLPASPTGGRHRTDTQVVTISGLTGPWVPAAFAPRAITIDTDISFDEQSSSIIANRDRLQVGTQYRVTSAIPAVRELDLTA